MRKLILGLMLAAASGASAQKISPSKVPPAVAAAFAKSYPAVSNAGWEKEHGNFEVTFRQDARTMSALYDASGKLMELERGIPTDQLPANVLAYLKAHFTGIKIREAAEIQMPNGTLRYEAEVKGRDQIFDGQGNFIESRKD